jgi:hypothetical protein
MKSSCLDAMNNSAADIVQRNPAPILITGTDLSADSQFERKKHFSYRAAM